MENSSNMKITPVGLFPEDWEIIQLGTKASVLRGGSPRPIDSFLTNDPDGINWIKIGDVAVGAKYIKQTEEKIIPEGAARSRKVYAGDFLLSNSMSFGRPYILAIDGCIHDGWLVLHFDKSKIDPVYLCSYLSQDSTYAEMSKLASGGVVSNLNSEIIKSLPALLPSIEQQKEYVTIVKKADESKLELRKSLDAIDKVIKSLINENL
jgi:type I restriction enzyme S subunit